MNVIQTRTVYAAKQRRVFEGWAFAACRIQGSMAVYIECPWATEYRVTFKLAIQNVQRCSAFAAKSRRNGSCYSVYKELSFRFQLVTVIAYKLSVKLRRRFRFS